MIKYAWSKTFVVVVVMFAFTFVFLYRNGGIKFEQAVHNRGKVKRELCVGEKMFYAGGYAAIKNIELEQGCDYESLADKMICSEGYHHVSTAKSLQKMIIAKKDIKSEPISLKSMAHALGVGVALSSLGKLPTDIEIGLNDQFIKYVYDGWGQHEAYLKKFLGLNSVCQFSKYNKYCEFGLGRAVFVLSPDKSKYKLTPWIQKGIEFAEIFEGAKVDRMHKKLQHREIATTLRYDKNAKSSKHYNCIRQPMGHILEC